MELSLDVFRSQTVLRRKRKIGVHSLLGELSTAFLNLGIFAWVNLFLRKTDEISPILEIFGAKNWFI